MPCQTKMCIDRENESKQNLLSLGSAILWWPLYIPRSSASTQWISQCPLPSLCFLADRKNKMAVPASELLSRTFSTSPLKLLNRIQRNLRGSKISISYTMYTKCVFFGLIGKTRWPTWPLIGWDIFDFSLKKKQGKKTLSRTSSYMK